MEKIKTDAEKKLFQKDDELDAHKIASRRQIETLQSQIEDNELRHKNDLGSIKKKLQVELDEVLYKSEQTTKAKVEAESQLKKAQLVNKVILRYSDSPISLLSCTILSYYIKEKMVLKFNPRFGWLGLIW